MSNYGDFSLLDGTFPCIQCGEESSKTIIGNHWKCSVCAHIFNDDGSSPEVLCGCDKCLKKERVKDLKKQKSLLKKLKNYKKSNETRKD